MNYCYCRNVLQSTREIYDPWRNVLTSMIRPRKQFLTPSSLICSLSRTQRLNKLKLLFPPNMAFCQNITQLSCILGDSLLHCSTWSVQGEFCFCQVKILMYRSKCDNWIYSCKTSTAMQVNCDNFFCIFFLVNVITF